MTNGSALNCATVFSSRRFRKKVCPLGYSRIARSLVFLQCGSGEWHMILHTILGAQLVVLAAAGPVGDVPSRASPASISERTAIVQQFVNRATECVVQAVSNKTEATAEPRRLGELIVAVMPSCVDRMRAMIDSFDSNFGEGSGEAFFSGSYLDLLPVAVSKRIAK